MRIIPLVIGLSLSWCTAYGQAPGSANLWRVSTASLTRPAALQMGSGGTTWNPAAELEESRLSASAQVVQTSDVVGLSSFLIGVSRSFGESLRLSVSGGRVDVRDLVRTTSSPASMGTIPVYEQYLGVGGQYEVFGLTLGSVVRLHDERFNLERNHGLTVDFGARFHATNRLVVAAASHFLPIDLSGRETTDYFAGAEYLALDSLSIGSITAQLLARYGLTYRAAEEFEHMVGGGLDIGEFFSLDASVAREVGYQSGGWRPAGSRP